MQRAALVPGDPYAVGPITLVDYSLVNANESHTEGFDFTASYRWRTQRYGSFLISAQATRIDSLQSAKLARRAVARDRRSGGLRCAAEVSEQRRGDLVSRTAGPRGWSMSYFGSYPQYNVGTAIIYVRAQGDSEVDSQSYHDVCRQLSFRFDPRRPGDVTVQFGIRNLLNERPPLDVYFPAYLYSSPFGDSRLRSVWASVGKRF